MRVLYDFIKAITNNKYDSNSDESTIVINFSYFEGLKSIVAYDVFKKINDKFPEIIKLYKIQNIFDEIELNNFLGDIDEYNEEIIESQLSKYTYKLIINCKEFIRTIHNKDDCNIRIYLDKKEFIDEINIKPENYKQLERKIFKCNKNIIIILNSDIIFYNEYCLIIGLNNDNIDNRINEFIGTSKLQNLTNELRNISCSWIEGPIYLNPNYTFFSRDNILLRYDQDILNKFTELTTNLSILSICNFSGEIDGTFKSILNSNKRIEISYNEQKVYKYENEKNLHIIYNWIYDTPSIDKLNICRNVISALLVATKCQNNVLEVIMNKSDLLLNSLKDNLESYAQENVSKFFEEKEKRKKELLKDIENVIEQTDSLIKLIVNNFTSLIAVSIAGVIAYIAKSDFLVVRILGILYTLQLDATLIINIPINIIKYFNTQENFKYIKGKYESMYFKDEDIKRYDHKMKISKTVFIIYSIVIFILIILINILAYKIIFNNAFLEWIKVKF